MLKVAELGLLDADLGKSVNLFLGAGFSTLAKNRTNDSLPVGDKLKNLLISEFGLEAYSSLDLPSLYAVIMSDRRDDLRRLLEKTYTVTQYCNDYDALRAIDVQFLYTTNIDDLPHHIFDARKESESRLLHDVYLFGAPRIPESVVQYVPLHGSVRHDDADFLFTAGQMSAAFASDRETWYVFQRELQARPTLFLGYGMRDAGVLQALHDGSSKNDVNRWILLRSDDPGASALYSSLGFHVMIGDVTDFLLHVASLQKVVRAPSQTNRSRFVG